jgi:hypothetical protein
MSNNENEWLQERENVLLFGFNRIDCFCLKERREKKESEDSSKKQES